MSERGDYLRRQRDLGRRVAAVWPARYPAEVLWAHRVCASELWDPPLDPELASAHLPAYVCGVAKAGFELLATGGAASADLLLFPHTCDTLQNLATVVRDLLGETRPCLTFHPPKARKGPALERFLRGEIRDLAAALSELTGPPSPENWAEALAWGERRNALLARCYRLRAEGRLSVSNAAFYATVRSVESLWPVDAANRLEVETVRWMEGPPIGGVPLVLSGVLPQPRDLPAIFDALGVAVVEDDFLACGRRIVRDGLPEDTGDRWTTLSRRHLALPPCSTAGSMLEERLDFLLRLVEGSSARGVVFLSLKFCDPEGFETPLLASALRARDIPVLVLETDLQPSTQAGLRTRLEAFLESLP